MAGVQGVSGNYGVLPVTPRSVEPLLTRSRLALASFGLLVVADIAAIVVDFRLEDAVGRLKDGERVPLSDLRSIDDALNSTGLAQFVLLVLCVITFLVWFHRAYKNAMGMGMANPRYTSGWAVGWWFIPFANLVMPKNVSNDLYRGSDPETPYLDPAFGKRPVSPLLHFWWAAWILSSILNRVASTQGIDDRTTLNELDTQATVYLLADGMEIIAAGLAVAVIIRITRMSEERRRRFPDGIPGGAIAAPQLPPEGLPPQPPPQANVPPPPPAPSA